MNLSVAGRDRSGDLGRRVAEEAARLRAGGGIGRLSPEHSALTLRDSADGDDYLVRFIELLRLRHGVRTADYYIPRAPGLRGRVAVALKRALWRLLRYQHDRMSYQQNAINELGIDFAEFQRSRQRQEVAALKERIAALERAVAQGRGP